MKWYKKDRVLTVQQLRAGRDATRIKRAQTSQLQRQQRDIRRIQVHAMVGLLFTLLIGLKWRASMWQRGRVVTA